MNRRWQADGIPFWRKLFSSNWWWYGEINPDPASLPPVDKRPKFWRWDVMAMTCMLIGLPLAADMATELNNRYWPFNQTTTYVGKIIESAYQYPQLKVELEDKTIVQMAFPMPDLFGFTNRSKPIPRWIPLVDELMRRQRQCPSQLMAFDAEIWKFSFRPLLTIWEVRCASGYVVASKNQIASIFVGHDKWAKLWIYGFVGLSLVFSLILINRRERKLYVKS
jgi:hypothetical protein